MTETKPEKETKKRWCWCCGGNGKRSCYCGGRVVWAIFLIFLGTVFLLNTLGVFAFNIFRLWPLILIGIGLAILLGHGRDQTR